MLPLEVHGGCRAVGSAHVSEGEAALACRPEGLDTASSSASAEIQAHLAVQQSSLARALLSRARAAGVRAATHQGSVSACAPGVK